ncbi:MAG: M24 family metallopeptidase [Desulfurococcaceae archaeon]
MGHNFAKLRELSETRGLDLLIVQAPDNIEYFTGVRTIGDATLLLTYSRRDDVARLYVPLLEYHRYRDALPGFVEVYAVSKFVKPGGIPVVSMDWKEIVVKASEGFEKIGVDVSQGGPLQLTIYKALGERAVDVSQDIWKARMIKSEEEVLAIKEAVEVTTKGIQAVVAELRDGVTEAFLAGVFEHATRKRGAEGAAFEPIVAFKPNNAYPHTLPGNRVLSKNDLVLVDVGVKVRGRCSDITRMVLWGRPSEDEKRAIEAVVEAANTAIDAVKPGVKASEVYEVAAKVLEKYGLREKFIHGLGHGIGILVHEPPYLRAGSEHVLEPGMVFTIEPGVYEPGKYGVRVEEDVLVTKSGAEVLSRGLNLVIEAT